MTTIAEVIDATARAHGLTAAQLVSEARTRAISEARQMAMLIARQVVGQSFPVLARAFHRDHTTILHGISAARARVLTGGEALAMMTRIIADLGGVDAITADEADTGAAMAAQARGEGHQGTDLAAIHRSDLYRDNLHRGLDRAAASQPQTIVEKALTYVAGHPGCTTKEISEATGVSTSSLKGVLFKLRETGALAHDRRGDRYRYYIGSAPEIAPKPQAAPKAGPTRGPGGPPVPGKITLPPAPFSIPHDDRAATAPRTAPIRGAELAPEDVLRNLPHFSFSQRGRA